MSGKVNEGFEVKLILLFIARTVIEPFVFA